MLYVGVCLNPPWALQYMTVSIGLTLGHTQIDLRIDPLLQIAFISQALTID